MRRTNFGFRVTDEERQMITTIAQRLERSESDTVRIIVRRYAREMGFLPQSDPPTTPDALIPTIDCGIVSS